MYLFKTKEDIDVFIEKVSKFVSSDIRPNVLLLLKSISLYLYYQCREDDWSVFSVQKLLSCCLECGDRETTYQTMLSWPDVNSEPVQLYEKFIASVGSSAQEYYLVIFECQSAVSFYCVKG